MFKFLLKVGTIVHRVVSKIPVWTYFNYETMLIIEGGLLTCQTCHLNK